MSAERMIGNVKNPFTLKELKEKIQKSNAYNKKEKERLIKKLDKAIKVLENEEASKKTNKANT